MPHPKNGHPGRLACTFLIGFIAITHATPKALAESSGTGSVVGDNIEAEVSFTAPPSTTTCQWRPALDITAGAKPGEVAISVRTSSGITESLYMQVCAGAPGTYHWIRTDVGPRMAAAAKEKVSRLVPALLAHTAPGPGRMIVNQPTWFWVPRVLWRPVSITASLPTPAGPIVVTTKATPHLLSLTPGDGHPIVDCKGPGRRWSPSVGDGAHSDCSYVYTSASHTRSASTYPARISVLWNITWRSNLGASGKLPSIRTGAGMNVTVAELQALSR